MKLQPVNEVAETVTPVSTQPSLVSPCRPIIGKKRPNPFRFRTPSGAYHVRKFHCLPTHSSRARRLQIQPSLQLRLSLHLDCATPSCAGVIPAGSWSMLPRHSPSRVKADWCMRKRGFIVALGMRRKSRSSRKTRKGRRRPRTRAIGDLLFLTNPVYERYHAGDMPVYKVPGNEIPIAHHVLEHTT